MAWLILIVAGIFEVGFAIGMKYTDGFTKPLPTILTVLSVVISMVLLGIAMKTLPAGTAYAIWTGIGTVGTVILGIILFQEPVTVVRMLCVALIIGGLVGLKMTHG
ncbi:MAG: multidrug efflux SMR transporter ['Candidatus Kapabacteria' thiocyanatum]|uniref:Guanidinium exporter n=1 Tax=Candidatus Kapaibacterium thiocyanatum TaxID=1895771 RepID=A0A1M3L5B6_9BACT|nr:multidrug efflux SMR transporter ['Candidatus Kapabacteria' thiocyanatum]OJX60740.1 MAG: QacE family quaternary ammonium compound efflux SMR transporter ['Candidatus Kapabacteria' thiocyanatum]